MVVDPSAAHQLALVKALLIAKPGNCHIHAFLCTDKDTMPAENDASRRDSRGSVPEDANHWLEQLTPTS